MSVTACFKALADETRLRLLHLALNYELNVNEITAILDMGQSRISRHLKILADAGLLRCRRDGLWVFYAAAAEGRNQALLAAVQGLFANETSLQDDLKKAESIRRARAQASRRFFNRIADRWPIMKREIMGHVDLNGQIVQIMPPCPAVADLGCGSGDLLPGLQKKSQRVIAVDHSPAMLAQAERRFPAGAIDFRIGEIEHLPLRDREVDCAVINMVLHHLPEPAAGIAEATRTLKKGGTLILAEFAEHRLEMLRQRYHDRWLGFDENTMHAWLHQAGLQARKILRLSVRHGLTAIVYYANKNANNNRSKHRSIQEKHHEKK